MTTQQAHRLPAPPDRTPHFLDVAAALRALSPNDPVRLLVEALGTERDPALLAALSRRLYREIFGTPEGAP